jgi:hypothetical protein
MPKLLNPIRIFNFGQKGDNAIIHSPDIQRAMIKICKQFTYIYFYKSLTSLVKLYWHPIRANCFVFFI